MNFINHFQVIINYSSSLIKYTVLLTLLKMEISFIDDSQGTNAFINHHNDIAFQKVIGLSYSLCIIYNKIKLLMEKNDIEIKPEQVEVFKNMEEEFQNCTPYLNEKSGTESEYYKKLKKGGEEFANKQHKQKGCVVCLNNIAKNMKCSVCKSDIIFYCSSTCQKKDWKNHKLFCKDLAKIGEKATVAKENTSKGKEKAKA